MPLDHEFGNLWDYYEHGWNIVIPTNIGWKKDGCNVMGAGLAKEAAKRFPDLPKIYGKYCKMAREDTTTIYYPKMRLILLPTKPLDEQPWTSWQGPSSVDLIKRSVKELRVIITTQLKFRVALSYPGCGNGGLRPKQVIPILNKYLVDLPPSITIQLVTKP